MPSGTTPAARRFADYTAPPPERRGLAVATTLRPFILVTYTADPARLAARLPPRLRPLTVAPDPDVGPRALVSVVAFVNTRLRAAALPWPAFSFPQINFRSYVVDAATGHHGVWFLHTMLGSAVYLVPRIFWHMPWTRARIGLEHQREGETVRWHVTAAGPAGPVRLELAQDGQHRRESPALPGFPDLETGLVSLTHAFRGFYRRRDGRLAVNCVWHGPIPVRPARLLQAELPWLARQGLVSPAVQSRPYSVLVADAIDFTSYLPPTVLS